MMSAIERPGTPLASQWTPIPTADGRRSSGILQLDSMLGGGYPAGSLALFLADRSVGLADLDRVVLPAVWDHLYRSRGVMAVLPAQDSPRRFRERVLARTTRRRFDSRVRVCDYVGEDDEAPYVVNLKSVTPRGRGRAGRSEAAGRMVVAEKAVAGALGRPYLEYIAFETQETLFGAETAGRMIFHGVKRSRNVGNLVLGVLRPGLGVTETVRSMAERVFELRREGASLLLQGIRPATATIEVPGLASPGEPPAA